MRKSLKSAISIFLAGTAVFISACKDKETTLVPLNLGQLDIWGCVATEKVLRDQPVEKYAEWKEEPDVNILMAKGEYESDQIIISPSVDVPYYNATITDLKLESGEDTISKDDISIYKQKYIAVNAVYQVGNNFPEGFYPDALLPIEAAVEYGETSIKAGENQGIYITVETKADQTAGIYTGSLTLDFKDFTSVVPVTVEVVDVAVSEVNHAKSTFLTNWTYQHGELNSTQEMRDAYSEALIKYRLAPNNIFNENNHTDEDIARYVEKSYEFMKNPKCSNIGIPYLTSSQEYQKGESYNAIDPVVFEKYLYKYAKKSFETGLNMLAKCTMYNAIIDEPLSMSFNTPNQVNLNCRIFNQTVNKVADAIEADTSITSEIKDEVVASMRVIPHVVTCRYVEKYANYESDEYINTFCPVTNECDSEAQRAQYDMQNEKWWYVANHPKFPYPNLMIDNTSILSTRAIGWMQGEYDITGFLYWSVNNYTINELGTGYTVCLEEYYETRANRNGNGTHGCGYLFYPGGQYGLDEPVGSLRLEALRDGLEEYELILSLKEKYNELGFSADKLISSITSNLYIGTAVSTDSNKFADARKSLLQLCAVANSSAEMCIVDSVDNGSGKVTNKVYIKDGYTLKVNGNTASGGEVFSEGKIYTVECKLENEVNTLKLSFNADGKEYTYEQNLGGKVTLDNASALVGGFSSELTSVTATLDGDYVKLDVGATTNKSQRFKLKTNTITSLDEKAKKIVLAFKNDSAEEISLTIYYSGTRNQDLSELKSVILMPNSETQLEVDVGSLQWAKLGNIEHFLIKLGNTKAENAKTVYMKEFVVYYK